MLPKDKIYLSLTILSGMYMVFIYWVLLFTVIQQLLIELNFAIFSVMFLSCISYLFPNWKDWAFLQKGFP